MKISLIVVALCLFQLQAVAASSALRFTRVDLKSGLSQATVLDIWQDQQGFMWFATQDGLNRFDGYDFVVYRKKHDDKNSLSDNYVNHIFEDSNGLLWLTTRNGLNRYDPETNRFTRYLYDIKEPGSLSANWTFAANEDRQGRIWVGTYESGLNVLDTQTGVFNHYVHVADDPNSLSDNGIYDIQVDQKGQVWVATRNGGVNRYNPQSDDFTRFVHAPTDPNSISHNKVYRIFQKRDGTLWFATRGGGLDRYDEQQNRFIHYRHNEQDKTSISDDHVWSIVERPNGDLLVGTFTGGLNLLAQDSDHFIQIKQDPSSDESLPGDSVISSFVDNTGIFWFGIRDVGLAVFNPDIAVFNHYKHHAADPNSLSENSVQSFLQTHNGEVMVATRQGGVNIFDLNTGLFRPLHQPQNNAHAIMTEPINQIAEDSQGQIWISFKDNGLVKYNRQTKQLTNYRHDSNDPHSISNDAINVLQFDSDGKLWLGTRDGLNRFDPATGHSTAFLNDPAKPESLSNDWVSALYIDHRQQLWVGTQRGLDRFVPETGLFEHFRHDPNDPQSISNNSIMGLMEDSNNNLWIATTSGVNIFDSNRRSFSHLKEEQGLSNDQVYGIVEDNQGNIWISTNFGLNKYDPSSAKFKLYTEPDGLQNNEFNQGAAYRLADGRLLFGGVNGFNLINPTDIKDNPYAPKVTLTQLRIFNQPVVPGVYKSQGADRPILEQAINYTESLVLSHQESVFSFEFSALHFGAPSRNLYAYRLDGFDRQWNYTDFKNRRATYTNLAAGHYTFEVKASNKDGVWSEQPVAVNLTILSPWWLTTGAKFLWLGLFCSGILLLFRWKTRQIQRQKTELQLQVTRQVAQVVAQKQALERSYNDIRVISAIGQKINASLDLEKVLWSVYEHINQLMDGTVFGIGLYKPEKNVIQIELAMEKGNRYKPYYRSMENKNQFPVWCIENDEVVFINDLEFDGRRYLERHEYDEYEKNRVYLQDGAYAGPPQSLIYVPIRSSETILGFITVQSFSKHAYQEVHVDILNTLAAYTGTAIVNSIEHRRLLNSRRELIESEKMASLGMLVAGVAHEINTPVGICLTTASSIEFETEQIFDAKAAGRLTESRLDMFHDKLKEGCRLLLKNLQRTSDLIANFKDVVVNPSVEISSTFNVRKLLIETVQTIQLDLDRQHIKLDLLCDEGFEVHTCASSLSRVVHTLISNSLLHAFADANRGKISIFVTKDGSDLQIRYVDNGAGMSADLAAHVFEPFYTTKRGDGCLGLGMHRVYNQVTQGLHGTVRCDSSEGQGMQVYISIPVAN